MAVYPTPATSTAAYLERTTAIPPFTNFTAMGWFRLDPAASYREFFYFGDSSRDYATPYISINNFGELSISIYDGSNFYDALGVDPLTFGPTWYHIAYVKTGNDHATYLSDESGSLIAAIQSTITIDANVTPLSIITEVYQRTAVQDVKIWAAALSPVEIAAERLSAAAIRTADLYLSTPLPTFADLTDTSGQGHDWTLGGGTLVTAGPPDLGGGGAAPNPPSDLVAVASGLERVSLTWLDNSTDENEFELQRCEGVGCTSWATIALLPPGTTSYLDPPSTIQSLTPSQRYRYRIRATNFAGASAWSAIAEVDTLPNYAVYFPSTAGAYLHSSTGLSNTIAFGGGSGGVMAWVRIDSSGYATIAASIENFRRCFVESVLPANTQEWDFASAAQCWTWFGVINGNLTVEAHDGRIEARGGVNAWSGTRSYASAGARAADIAAFRATYAGLPYNDGLTVPIPTWETTFIGNLGPYITYFAFFPTGVDPEHGDLTQHVTVTGPALTPGVWYRVGFRWVSVPTTGTLPPSGYSSSTLELYVACALVASGAWDPTIQGGHGFLNWSSVTAQGRYADIFCGGLPNDTHRAGRTPTPITITDWKAWDDREVTAFPAECDTCAGNQPDLWWKARNITDLDDYGSGWGSPPALPAYPAFAVGSLANGDPAQTLPYHPCNVDVVTPPPPPPPTTTGTLVVIKQVSPSTDPTAFVFTAHVPTPVSFSLSHDQSETFAGLAPGNAYAVVEYPPTGWSVAYAVSNGSPVDQISIGAGETVTVVVINTYTGVPTPPPSGAGGCPPVWSPGGPTGAGCATPPIGV